MIIKKKKKYIKDNSQKLLQNSKNKIKSDLSKEQNEKIKLYEETLKEQMNQEIGIFKNKLILNLEKDYQKKSQSEIGGDISSEINSLEIKKNKLESDIRIQKERNINKKNNECIKSKNNYEEQKSYYDELYKTKKSTIDLQNKNKITNLEKDLKKKHDKNINEIKLRIKQDFDKANKIEKQSINEILTQYSNELKEQFEDKKNEIYSEYEQNNIEELENYKIKKNLEKNENIKQINEDINNLSKNYFTELDIIKKEFNQKLKKEEEKMKNNIQKIPNLFDEIKNNNINNADKEIKEIENSIKNILQNKNDMDNYNYIKI